MTPPFVPTHLLTLTNHNSTICRVVVLPLDADGDPCDPVPGCALCEREDWDSEEGSPSYSLDDEGRLLCGGDFAPTNGSWELVPLADLPARAAERPR